MAATLAVTVYDQQSRSKRIRRYVLAWVSHTDGVVNIQVPQNAYMNGILKQVEFQPDGGGTAPTTLYDVLLVSEHGADLLIGAGANLAITGTVIKPIQHFPADGAATPAQHDRDVYIDGRPTLNVTNAGSGKGGKVILYVE